jgi:membrane-bound ClpP family serine protease
MMTHTPDSSRKPTWLPGAAAILAFVACNGVILIVAMLSLFGVTIAINPHIQAAAISVFAVLTLGFVFLDYRRHHTVGPLALSAVGAVIIVGTMYISFSKIVESLGLLVLIISAIWSWRVSKAHACPTAAS